MDSFERKAFDELQIGTGFVSRQFHYHAGEVTEEHKDNAKLKSSATTQLISQIVLSGGRTISYEYDEEERITKVDDSVDGITEYTYDALGQLVSEVKDNQTVVNTMTYDNYGNIKTKNGVVYAYDTVWKDKLISYNGQEIVYDEQGNPTEYLGHTLTWEKGRQLKSFDGNTYTYNANGIRTSKTVDGIRHNFVLDGAKILRETWCNNTLVPLYDNEDSVCGIEFNGTAYYFLKNLQGDIIAITDNTGKDVARYSYDAWGVCTIESDTTDCNIAEINPYRYRGYYLDREIGMYYLQSRYYDPVVGRFVNGDEAEFATLSGSLLLQNLFAYCGNEPVDYVDEFGEIRCLVTKRKAKIKGTVLTISQFLSESMQIATNLSNILVSMKVVVIEKNADSLVRAWNKLKQKDLVIINCHGNPKSINGVTIKKSKELSSLPIKLLILLACNVGHYDLKKSNIAYAFYKKIRGVGRMLCSDGTVNSWYAFNFNSKFKSVADESWKLYTTRKDNKGWMIYGDGRKGVSIYASKYGKTIHIKKVVQDLLFL